MKTTKLKIEMELEGSTSDVLDSPSLTQWLGQMWMMCQLCQIPVKIFLDADELDITLLDIIQADGGKPS